MTFITRRTLLLSASAFAAVGLTAGLALAQLPTLEQKDTYKVGFSQVEMNNPWRIAQTESMQSEAEALGYEMMMLAGSTASLAVQSMMTACGRWSAWTCFASSTGSTGSPTPGPSGAGPDRKACWNCRSPSSSTASSSPRRPTRGQRGRVRHPRTTPRRSDQPPR